MENKANKGEKAGKNLVSENSNVIDVDHYHTSKACSRCWWVNKDLRGSVFECKACGLKIDR